MDKRNTLAYESQKTLDSLMEWHLVNETIFLVPISPTLINESTLAEALSHILRYRLLCIKLVTPTLRDRITTMIRILVNDNTRCELISDALGRVTW